MFFGYFTLISVKPVLSRHPKRRPKSGFQDGLLLNAGHRYCRMLQGEHSVVLLTIIKLALVIKILVLIFLSERLRQVSLYVLAAVWLLLFCVSSSLVVPLVGF